MKMAPVRCRHRLRAVLGCLAVAVSLSCEALASENGQTHYPVGVDTIMSGVMPAPGQTQFYLYTQHYQSDRTNDSAGRSLDPGFNVEVQAFVPRVMHTWQRRAGPFQMSSGALLPFTRVRLRAFGQEGSSTGAGDLVLFPLYLGYVNPIGTVFAYGGPVIYAPTGKYDENRLANNGLNYWSIAPTMGVTWLPHPRWELSAGANLEFNRKNSATDYRSGHSAMLDFGVGVRPLAGHPKLKIAAQGFGLVQFTDDRQHGAVVGDGNRGRAFGFGPQVSYDIAGGRGGMVLKYQREFGVENRSEGERFWFMFTVPL